MSKEMTTDECLEIFKRYAEWLKREEGYKNGEGNKRNTLWNPWI